MSNPPPEYLAIDPATCRHNWWQGTRGIYSWLQSEHLSCADFFNNVPPPTAPFRVAVTMHDGFLYDDYYSYSCGWEPFADGLSISPVLTSWPEFAFGEEGDGYLILPASTTAATLTAIFANASAPLWEYRYMEHRIGSVESELDKNFWSLIESLQPLSCAMEGQEFTLVSPDPSIIQELIDSEGFKNVDAELHRQALDQRSRAWDSIGPETGPETCIEPDCSRLRIQRAVRCFLHQLAWCEHKP